jgi:hypothetical protein
VKRAAGVGVGVGPRPGTEEDGVFSGEAVL